MKAYYINMVKDTAKRALIESQVSTFSMLVPELFQAVEGRKMSNEALQHLGYPEFKAKYGNFGTLPAFGCSMSHFNLYNKMAKASEESALILEDDAILSPKLANELQPIEEYINKVGSPAVILLTPDFIYHKSECLSKTSNGTSIVKVENGCMTSGYIINKAAAQLLSSVLFPIRFIADEWAEFQKLGLTIYGVVPHLVSYPEGLGEIGRSQHLIKESTLKKLRHVVGRCKARLFHIIRYCKGYRKSYKLW